MNPIRSRFEYFLARCATLFIEALPADVAWLMGCLIGRLTYMLDVRHRKVGLRNLRRVYPEFTDGQIRRRLRSVYDHLGKVMVEMVRAPRMFMERTRRGLSLEKKLKVNRFLTLCNFNKVQEICSEGRGVIFVTAHLGNWELGAAAMALIGLPLYVVVRTMDNPLLDRYVTRLREDWGQRILRKHGSMREALSLLKSGRRLGIVVDQNTPVDNVFVDFLGEKAAVTRGVAALALKSDSVIFPGYAYRANNSPHHVVVVGDPIEVPKEGDREEKIFKITQQYTKAIEGWIKKYPEQWLWIHNRWKTRPPQDR